VDSEPFVITVPVERLDDASFDNVLLRQLSTLYRRLRYEALPLAASHVLIDLRTVRSIFPYAALGLLVLLQGLAPIFQAPIRLLLPAYAEAPACIRWMAQSGFIEAAQPWAEVDCEVPHSVRDDAYLVPVRILATKADHQNLIHEVLAKVPCLLQSTFGEEGCVRITTAFSELSQNILSYAKPGVAAPGFVMLQAFREIVKFAVADAGPGIPATLRPSYDELREADDSTVIAFAMRPGVTSRAQGGGLGLYHLREVIRLHHGILNIRSGSGKLLVHNDTEYLYQPRGLYRAPMYFWGTQIGVVLHRA
jgi:anti-sigma regulatory factor (Ser/Thr protein kinase)